MMLFIVVKVVCKRLKVKCFQMGYSVMDKGTNEQSVAMGVLTSGITSKLRYIGTSGSFKGDTGGGCWDTNGRLIGLQVGVLNVPHSKDTTGKPAPPATGGRCNIVPVSLVKAQISVILVMSMHTDNSTDFLTFRI